MPSLSRKLLVDLADPATIRPLDLMDELNLPDHTRAAAELGVASSDSVLTIRGVLSPDECSRLRGAIDSDWQEKLDSVDGGPDHQLNLNKEQLTILIGNSSSVDRLWQLPSQFDASAVQKVERDGQSWRILVRRYSTTTRPWNPFHVDGSALTINVALNSDSSFDGGRLLACTDGQVRVLSRGEGDLTLHSSQLLHGVSRMLEGGTRYSLIIFIGKAQTRPKELVFGSDGMATLEDEGRTLLFLLTDHAVLEQWKRVCGTEVLESLHARFEAIQSARLDLGRAVEHIAVLHGAPHLRPTYIENARKETDAAFWSLRQLIHYMMTLVAKGGWST